MVEAGNLRFRQLTEADVALLVRWLSDPRVLEYYEGRDRPHEAEMVRQHFLQPDDYVVRCIVERDGEPIGYQQFYPLEPASKDEYGLRQDEDAWGIDQFIGEPALWNQGIGTRQVRLIAEYLKRQVGAARVVTDPQVSNARALRAYEKAGFRKVRVLKRHELHEGKLRDCWLMEFVGQRAVNEPP